MLPPFVFVVQVFTPYLMLLTTGGWSSCSISCIEVGMGIRTRTRQCIGGVAGRGGCIGSSVIAEKCMTDTCLAICPPGFLPMGKL